MLTLIYSILNGQICIIYDLYNTKSIVYIHVLFSLNSSSSHFILTILSFTTSSKRKTTKINGKCNKMELRTVYILKKITENFFTLKEFYELSPCL